MRNLNQENENLFNEVQKAQFTNPKFVWYSNSFDYFAGETLSFMKRDCVIPADLEQFVWVTIQRVELQNTINDYIRAVNVWFDWVSKGKEFPVWVVRNEEDDSKNFEKFFLNVDSVAWEVDLFQIIDAITHKPLAEIKTAYQDWISLKEKEIQKKESISLIEQAWDFRNYLISTLRLYGYWPNRIEEVLVV